MTLGAFSDGKLQILGSTGLWKNSVDKTLEYYNYWKRIYIIFRMTYPLKKQQQQQNKQTKANEKQLSRGSRIYTDF